MTGQESVDRFGVAGVTVVDERVEGAAGPLDATDVSRSVAVDIPLRSARTHEGAVRSENISR